MTTTPAYPDTHKFLNGSTMMGGLIAQHDWSATALGPIDGWSAAVTTTVGMILRSAVPIVTLWRNDGVMIYNDAYSVFAGGRHPQLLGSKVREGWPEVAAFNDNVMRVCLAGDTLAYQDQELTLHRHGTPEPVWMNLDYSPVLGADGEPEGVIAIVVETTAKVRAERRLNGEHARLNAMFQQAPGFMAMLSGPDHVFTLANDAYFELVGQRELIGKSVRAALPEVTAQGYAALLDGVYASGISHIANAAPVVFGNDDQQAPSARYLDFVYQPIRNEDGAVVGIFVQGADVSDRVVAQQRVLDDEARFRTWAQAMPNQVWSARADGALDWFNQRLYDYTGAAAGTLDGAGWMTSVLPDDVGGAAALWAAAVDSGNIFETEYRIRRADGAYRWHLVRALPIHAADGTIVSWIGTNTDIDQQKDTERALAYLNATLEQQVEQRTAERDRVWRLSNDIIIVADLESIIVAVNPAWQRLLGWDEEQALGQSILQLVHPDDRQMTQLEMLAMAQGRPSLRFENRYQRKDGGYSVLSWTGTAAQGYVHAIGRDVTADREAAQAMQRTELALRQAQKMETIGKLTGGVAHDFNNLLQVISGNLQLLAPDVAGNTRAERRLGNAMAGVTRGAKLSSYLLAFGRRQPLEPKVVRLSRLVQGMEDMLRRSLGEEIEVETVISGGLWHTFADSAQVENAILNLAINGRDAMGGSGRLTIELGNAFLDDAYAATHAEVIPGQYVVLAISDTGAGMAPDVLAQAFEPFFSTKPEGQGTGLGLSMVYGFVKQSGGHVKIYSEVGLGTTVKVYLPRSLESEDVVAFVEPAAAVGGAETILVAEDDEQVRGTVVELLGALGYRVLKAHDAIAALTIIDSGVAIDLLFTDVVMPGPLRSPDLARKARERLPQLAVLFTSGYTENAIVHGGRLDAGVELLGKPYTKEALALKVRKVLAARPGPGRMLPESLPAVLAAPVPAPAAAMRVLLVEDDDMIRINTAELLDYLGHVVLQAADAAAALELLHDTALGADVLITDIGLPGMPGDVLAQRARQLRPGLGVIFATGRDDLPAQSGTVLLRKPYDTAALHAAIVKVGGARA